ncbi:MAG TPA: ABC-type transport auxiliary lipoprotein family protein [Kofleriaceae bacterium]|nr:ABC-type transport auxiliary lipoprotein family protein [Kofleriaceae bacterium]
MTRAVLVLLVVAACSGKLPATRFYQLAEPAGKTWGSSGVALVVEVLTTDSAYDDERIVYRVTPYRLDYYNYHRWSAAPGLLIANYLERAFEKSGHFGSVTREPNPAAPVTLGGRVIAIEEVDQTKTKWLGRIVLELTLTDSASGAVVWAEQFEETEPLPTQSPEGLARALSVALERIANRAVPAVSLFATQTAKAHESMTATQSRAARLRP